MFLMPRYTLGFVNINLGNEENLKDHRGHSKPVKELDENAEFKLRIKELEAYNMYLEMENAFQNKLEIQRRKLP